MVGGSTNQKYLLSPIRIKVRFQGLGVSCFLDGLGFFRVEGLGIQGLGVSGACIASSVCGV